MSKYKHLAYEDRVKIETYKELGYSNYLIARLLQRSESTISREINRNKDPVNCEYTSKSAEYRTKLIRRKANQSHCKIQGGVLTSILEGLNRDWSPEQITGRERNTNLDFVCKSTIYNYIYTKDKNLTAKLRIIGKKGKYTRKKGTRIRAELREESKKKRIDVRPEIIETRSRLGDFEGDTIVGGEKTIHLLTHVDRKSGYLVMDLVVGATAKAVQEKTVKSLGNLPTDKLQSITYDNGVQFALHESTEQKLNTDIYFAYPYHSWERGTNENTNGLVRQYFPKKSLFGNLTDTEIDKVKNLINSRPRKRLGYLTPEEVFIQGKEVTAD
jgi:transposase, IS30 family